MSTPTTTSNTEEPRELAPGDYENLYHQQREENERLKTLIASSRLSPVAPHAEKDAEVPVTAARARALLGPVQLLNMSREDKIRSLSVDPATVDDNVLRELFGRGSDGKALAELQRKSPYRVKVLRECALLLNIYGA